MGRKRLTYHAAAGAGAILLLILAWFLHSTAPPKNTSHTDADIMQTRTLRATTEYSAIGYYVDHDTLAGLHYELIHAFARDKGFALQLTPEMSFERQIDGLHNNTYDLIAGSILITGEQRDSLLSFTTPILSSRQILIQRKPTPTDSGHISIPLQLGGKTVYVPQGSPVIYRLKHLGDEIGDTIHIAQIERYGAEQLMAMVAHGDIDYTVCEEGVALTLADQYPQLDLNTPVSFSQFYGWAVPTTSQALLDTLNTWLNQYKQTPAFRRLLEKYRP